ncbi:ABC transporter permease [uncultured Pseudodesulfovibrio sp.]|uniref:ABC transporter permease n=1 Tax=uncultured Pseudodesulfovibrio sp. TaxID=2035858 RepID=UPI0029C68C51|nr:ABC transporter permease [uncultured Pseudodesulfovibrio sp.]
MISFSDLLHVSLRQVVRQRKRNLGIVLAIALGTAGLIVIMSMGDEVKKNLNRDLDLLGGATLIKVEFEDEKNPGERVKSFHEDSLEALRATPGVDVVSRASELVSWMPLFKDKKNHNIPVLGVDYWFWSASSLKAIHGALLSESTINERAVVCVVGPALAKAVFGVEDAVGQYLPLQGELYRVIGVVSGLQIGDRTNFAFIPLTTAQDRKGVNFKADRLYLRCKTWDDVKPVSEAIPEIIAAHQDPKFLHLEVSWAQLKRVVTIVWWVELFVYLSIGATLILGGFGIWNGMMTAVTSRTREIGLKKAMGAEPVDIMGQFLCESLCLSVSASVLGILLGYATVMVSSHYLGSTPSRQIFLSYTGISIAFSGALGLVAGFYPALRASKLDAVTAIRYE